MDSNTRAHVLHIALCLLLYSIHASAMDNYVTLKQEGTSVLHNSTKLLCSVKETLNADFLIMWAYQITKIATVERRGRYVKANSLHPGQYACEWIEDETSSVLTIKRTTLDEEGEWSCNFKSSDGCVDSSILDLKVVEKASTRVTGLTHGHPTEGQHYTLHCGITHGRPRVHKYTEWKRNGVKQAETGDMLTIPEVARSMDGSNYTCATDNGAGLGQHGAAFTVTVWYKPSVTVSGASHILEESMVTLGCRMTDGYPRHITGVQWLKDGSALSRLGIEGGTVDNPSITLQNVTVDDAGVYVCVLSNRFAEGQSDAFQMKVHASWRGFDAFVVVLSAVACSFILNSVAVGICALFVYLDGMKTRTIIKEYTGTVKAPSTQSTDIEKERLNNGDDDHD